MSLKCSGLRQLSGGRSSFDPRCTASCGYVLGWRREFLRAYQRRHSDGLVGAVMRTLHLERDRDIRVSTGLRRMERRDEALGCYRASRGRILGNRACRDSFDSGDISFGTPSGAQRRRAASAAAAEGRCPSCGYDRRATTGRCPECGAAPRESAAETRREGPALPTTPSPPPQ
jgi:hypothetical protein